MSGFYSTFYAMFSLLAIHWWASSLILFAFVKRTVVNMGTFHTDILRSGISGSFDRSIFGFLSKLYTAFCKECINLHSCQQRIRVPFPSCPCQDLLFVFLVIATVTEM